MHGDGSLAEGSRSTNFSFKKDFVKDSMVVLGPERTFKLRNPLVSNGSGQSSQLDSNLLHAIEDGRLAGSPSGSPTALHKAHRYVSLRHSLRRLCRPAGW